jgi:hypothetical protein
MASYMRGRGLRRIKHLPQSPLQVNFFYITTFVISFYQSNFSTGVRIPNSVWSACKAWTRTWRLQWYKENNLKNFQISRLDFKGDTTYFIW